MSGTAVVSSRTTCQQLVGVDSRRTEAVVSKSAAGFKLSPSVPGSPPVASHAALAVKLIVAGSTATEQAPNAICDARTTAALRRSPPPTPTDSPGSGMALVRLAPTIRRRRKSL